MSLDRVLVVYLAILSSLALSSCRFNFIPVFPQVVKLELPVRLEKVSLIRQKNDLVAHATIQGKFEPAFMKISWFEGSRLIGEDSVYLDQSQRSATFTIAAPTAGAYRAAISFGGVVLRQVELYEVKP